MGKPAARVGDMHTCPLVNPGPTPHVGGPVLPPGGVTVLIGGQPAARVGDMATCTGPPDSIAMGSFTVLIGGKPAARLGDTTAHGGAIAVGFPTVLIGGSAQAVTLKAAAADGVPFCEECAAAARKRAAAVASQEAKVGQPNPTPAPGKPVPKVTFEDATPDQQKTITAAHNKAIGMTDRAIARLEAAKTKPDAIVKKYFGINGNEKEDQKNLATLIKNYSGIKSKLGEKFQYEIENEPLPKDPAEPYTTAYVYSLPGIHGIGDVHVCFPAFDTMSENQQGATVVHELSHYTFGSDDHAYEHQTKKWNKMSQKDRMNNAGSYGGFARDA